MSQNLIVLKRFDVGRIKPRYKHACTVVIIDDLGVNKNKLIEMCLSDLSDIPLITVISATNEHKLKYKNNDNFSFYDETTPNLLKAFKNDRQTLARKFYCDEADTRGLLVINDIVSDNFANDPSIDWMFQNSKHIVTSIIVHINSEYMTPLLRANADYIFICKPKPGREKRLYDLYATMIPNFNDFYQMLMTATRLNNCLVIDNTSLLSDKLEDRVFWL